MALQTTLISRVNSFLRALPKQRPAGGGQRRSRLIRSKFSANVWLDRSLDAAPGKRTVSSYELRFVSDRALVSGARRAAVRFAYALSAFDGGALDDIELAVGEALANAVEHGHRDGSYISLRCESRDDGLQVTVRDGGAGFDPRKFFAAGPCADRGYGIGIMRRCMDRVEFLSRGTTAKMLKRFITTPVAPHVALA